jgi:hypothetical protein
VPFDRVSRIIYRAQTLPSLNVWRYLNGEGDWAFFIISVALKDEPHELSLFTVWQQQPRRPGVVDRIAGVSLDEGSVGDEAAGRVIELLRRYIGAPLASH